MLPRIYDPFEEMEEMMRYLPSIRNTNAIQQRGFVPAMDVYETKNDVVVETTLAGINPKDVEVSVENGLLTIKGESKKEHEVEEKNYYRKEVRSGSFHRKVDLPKPVKEDEVSAEFEDGILRITCPKAKPNKGKKVSVKVVKRGKK